MILIGYHSVMHGHMYYKTAGAEQNLFKYKPVSQRTPVYPLVQPHVKLASTLPHSPPFIQGPSWHLPNQTNTKIPEVTSFIHCDLILF